MNIELSKMFQKLEWKAKVFNKHWKISQHQKISIVFGNIKWILEAFFVNCFIFG